jgi:hypothetical protein
MFFTQNVEKFFIDAVMSVPEQFPNGSKSMEPEPLANGSIKNYSTEYRNLEYA